MLPSLIGYHEVRTWFIDQMSHLPGTSGSPACCTCVCHAANTAAASPSRLTSELLEEKDTHSSRNSLVDLDQDIYRRLQVVRALQSRRNALLPISQLPCEILCRIFEYVAPSDLTYGRDLRWIAFSHVSQCWRETALSCAALWRFVPIYGPTELTREFLRRSKSAPLALNVFPRRRRGTPKHAGDLPAGVALAFDELHRVVTLIFNASASCDLSFLEGYRGAAAPMLETLTIEGWGSPESRNLFLEPIFPADTPRLRILKAREVNLKWPLSLPSGLTDLTLADEYMRVNRPTESQLYDMIRSLDNLEYMSLQGTLPATELFARPISKRLLLKNLRRLEITDDADSCAAFLQHVVVPDGCSLSINCNTSNMGNKESIAVAVATVIDHHRKSCKSRESSGLLVAVRFTLEPCRLYFRETWFEHSQAAVTAPIQIQEGSVYHIGLSLGIGEADLQNQMKMIFDALLWDDVQRFEIAGSWGLDEAIIQNMPTPLAHVDTVQGSDHAAVAILKALYQSKAAEHLDEQLDLFPALRVLVLARVSLGTPQSLPPDVSERGQVLLDILSAGRSGIRKVVLRSCSAIFPALFAIPDVEVLAEEIDPFDACVSASHPNCSARSTANGNPP